MAKGIKYTSYADRSGYGASGIAYMQGLVNAGIPLTWQPFVFEQSGYVPWTCNHDPFETDHEDDSVTSTAVNLPGLVYKSLDYGINLLHTQPEYWPAYWEPGKRRIGYTVWETDLLPRTWLDLLDSADQIIVPCRFNLDVFRAEGIKRPIAIIPHIYREPYPALAVEISDFRKRLGIHDDLFVFYSINTWTNRRKAMTETVSAYMDAFTADDPVVLVVKTDPLGLRNEMAMEYTPTPQIIAELCAGRPNPPEIRLISHFQMSRREIELLHRIGDCYVSLTHSEGWGLGAFDAAGFGNPVIITGWGGHLDYFPKAYPGLVNYRLVGAGNRCGFRTHSRSQHWASADREHAIQLMRDIVSNPGAMRALAELTRHHIRTAFSEPSVIERLITVIYE